MAMIMEFGAWWLPYTKEDGAFASVGGLGLHGCTLTPTVVDCGLYFARIRVHT